MKRSLLLFLLKLLPASLILGWLWFSQFQRGYPYFIDPVATFFFKLFGVRTWHLSMTAEHFTNLVPFLALWLATPGLVKMWKRAVTALVAGLAVIVLVHIAMSIAIYYIVDAYQLSKSAYRIIVPVYLINDAMPLILWLAFFPGVLSELFKFVRLGRGTRDKAPGAERRHSPSESGDTNQQGSLDTPPE